MLTEFFFSDKQALVDACAAAITEMIGAALQSGEASLFVSGGSTPKAIYAQLANTDLAWQKVSIAMVDERYVPLAHLDSNEAMIRGSLVTGKASAASFNGLYSEADSLAKAAQNAEQIYSRLVKDSDLIILGMGDDGHTASLFPNADGISAAMDITSQHLVFPLVANKSKVTGENLARISLGLAAILAAKKIILLITGDDKLAVYKQALIADVNELPVAAVLQQNTTPIDVYWAP
jgi:6-phosphogluconolactonase|tara:strand:+ start:105 stop:809 length:705 start_codon:yes stop_codon:yes gene_type:complete